MRIKPTKKYQETQINFDSEFGTQIKFEGFDPSVLETYIPPSDRLGTGGTFEAQNYTAAKEIEIEKPTKIDYTPHTLKATKKPSVGKIILNTLANPLATWGYSVRNEPIPWGRVGRGSNNVDAFVLGMVNPAAWVESGVEAYKDFTSGDIWGGLLNTLGVAPVIPASISQARHLRNANKIKHTRNLSKELNTYNDKGLFRNITNRPDGKLSNSQIKTLSENENLANTVVKNAIKNNEKITGYRAVNPQNALQNPKTKEALLADGVDITDEIAVSEWLVTRPHIGGHSMGYRAGGGGSDNWLYGDYVYTKPRWSLLQGRNKAPFTTPIQGKTTVNAQAQTYGPYLSKIQYKGTNHLLDFTSGDRSSWVKRLDDFEPWTFTPAPGSSFKTWPSGDLNIKYNPNTVPGVVTKSGEIVDPNSFFFVDRNIPMINAKSFPEFTPTSEAFKRREMNMWFGARGHQIFDVLQTKPWPRRLGSGPKNIYRNGGHIRTNNLTRNYDM